ncbi:MAG: hypothetical protein ACI9QD_001176 [Thermoproteota archaeon]|jgi:hypothetical protein
MFDFYQPYTIEGKHHITQINPFIEFMKKVKLKDKPVPDENFIILDRVNLGFYMRIEKWKASIDWLSSIKKYKAMYLD